MYHELPVGAVVRLRNGKTATIVTYPSHWVENLLYPVAAVIEGEKTPDNFTKEGEYYAGIEDREGRDIVAVEHYGQEATVSPDVVEIDRLIDQLRDLGVATPKTCGSLVPPEQRQAMIQRLRGMLPPERVKAPVVAAVAEALKKINRIERKDVDDFRNGNYCERNALDQYQEIATKSAIYPGQGTPFGVMYAALGLAEAGEIQNKVKKMFRDDGVIDFVDVRERETVVRFNPITPERRAMIVKEMGGNLWYLAALAKEIGTTLSEIAGNNLDELCGRTDRDTLNGDGDNR
jgi:hypothetical protein